MTVTLPAYQDSAVLMPDHGAVYVAAPGTEPPTLDAIQQWIATGRDGDIAGGWKPIGYTSLDEMPAISAEIEGGKTAGSWENHKLRTTAVTCSESIVVSPIQWSEEPIRRRWGAGAKLDGATGRILRPDTYEAVEDAVLVLFVSGTQVLGLHWWKGASAPEGEIKPSEEAFMALPFKYTFLTMPGKEGAGFILGAHLETKDTDGDGIPDHSDDTPGTV